MSPLSAPRSTRRQAFRARLALFGAALCPLAIWLISSGRLARPAETAAWALLCALLAASADREALLRQIDEGTAALITPEKMKSVLQSLLQAQQGLSLTGMQSFSEPVRLAEASAATSAGATKTELPTVLYRHGLVLQLEGGYFDLLQYLQAVHASGWKLNWDSLDYRVGEAGPGRAKISLKLFTLSRKAGWVGV